MKRSTKILAMVVAIAFVAIAMTIVIYSATAGNTNISANVSWVSQSAVDLEFWAMVTGGSENKSIAKTQITPSTTNQKAGIVGDLSCNFKDSTDDGINNPSPITFKYYVKNNSLTPLNIMVTKTPDMQNESGTNPADHKPKVEIVSTAGGLDVLGDVVGTLGYNLSAGDTFVYTVIVSLASGGTADVDADMGMTTKFDAGVTFNFNIATSSNGYISTIIDNGTPTTVASNTVSGRTLGDYLDSKSNGAYTTGWFFDKELTKVVTENNLKSEIKDSANASLYTRTASASGLNFTLSSDGNSYLVSGQSTTSPSGEVVIPSRYNGKPVSGVASSGFKRNKKITSVILPNTITWIQAEAFFYCDSLTNVVFHDNITSISSFAFYYTNLNSIVIPINVTFIDANVFVTSGLKQLTVEAGNPKYDSRENCNAVIETETNTLVLSTDGTTFIPNGITTLGKNAFYAYKGGTSMVIPNSVTTIKEQAFCQTNITNFKIPKSVINIALGAFNFAYNTVSIEVDKDNPKYDSRENCNAIIETATNKLLAGCVNTVIPSSVKTLGTYAYYGNYKLINFVLPKHITKIGQYAFSYCQYLKNISVEAGNPIYDSRNNCHAIIETATNKMVSGFKTTTFPESVTSIGSYAFRGMCELKSITIPSNIKTIEYHAFIGCTNLTSVTIESGVTTLGNRVFESCTGLTKIFIPASVTTIAEYLCKDSPSVKLYCEASLKPSGWANNWNEYASGSALETHWGVTRAEFDAL